MKRTAADLGEYRPRILAPGIGVFRWDRRLELKGPPGVLRLGFFGTGSAFAMSQFQSNMVVIKGGTAVFIDLGNKTTLKLAEFGLSVHDIPQIIVTHSHADHAGSLEELGLKRRYEAPVRQALAEGRRFPPQGDGSIFARIAELKAGGTLRTPLYVPASYAAELWEQTLKGGMAYSEEVDLGGPRGQMKLEHFFDLRPPRKLDGRLGRDAWELEIGQGAERIHFLIYVTPHIPDTAKSFDRFFFSAGLVIDDRVLISGDTQFDPWVFETFGARGEAIFHDAQSFPGGVHAFYGDLCGLPPAIKAKLWLYHCDDGLRPLQADGHLGARDVARDGFAGFAEPIPVFYEF